MKAKLKQRLTKLSSVKVTVRSIKTGSLIPINPSYEGETSIKRVIDNVRHQLEEKLYVGVFDVHVTDRNNEAFWYEQNVQIR